jgi:hypothetical protein
MRTTGRSCLVETTTSQPKPRLVPTAISEGADVSISTDVSQDGRVSGRTCLRTDVSQDGRVRGSDTPPRLMLPSERREASDKTLSVTFCKRPFMSPICSLHDRLLRGADDIRFGDGDGIARMEELVLPRPSRHLR